MNAGTRVIRNSLANILGNIFIKVLTLTFWAFVARRLSVEDFGIFAFAFATIGIIASLSDFGISYLVMREVSRETARAREYFANSVLLKLLFALVAFGVLAVTLILLGSLGIKARLLMILGLTLPITAVNMAIFSIFNAFEKMHLSALLESLSTFIYLVFGSALLLNGGGLLQLGWAYVTSSMTALAVSLWL
ncbi:MAG: oligosaccharide flippase family protein, partial [candidate division KSB1 bacterium]|nr:oligosaccharide flippase family protein [candidate division KSB1 bacterium]